VPATGNSFAYGAGIAQPAVPTLLYDSVEPAAIPSGHTIATYSDGPFAQSSAAVAGRGDVADGRHLGKACNHRLKPIM